MGAILAPFWPSRSYKSLGLVGPCWTLLGQKRQKWTHDPPRRPQGRRRPPQDPPRGPKRCPRPSQMTNNGTKTPPKRATIEPTKRQNNSTQHNTTQHNTTQHNTTTPNTTQCTTTQNTTQHSAPQLYSTAGGSFPTGLPFPPPAAL